jgi:PAS domain S-box-containing protein
LASAEKLHKQKLVHEQKLLAEVQAERTKLNNLFMQAPVAIAILKGPQYIIELANPAVCEFWGRELEQVINNQLFKAIPEARGQGYEELLDGVYKTGITYQADEVSVVLLRKGRKEKIYFNFVYQPVRDSNGTISGVIVIANEITEQFLAQQKIVESEERYRTLFNSIDEGFCIVEMHFDKKNKPVNYIFLETNPVFEKQTGLKNAVGKTIKELAPKLENHWLELYGKIALTGKPVRFENQAKALHRWYDVYATRVGGKDSRKVAILFNDITRRKDEEERRIQVEKQKDEFIGIASHELKTPVTSIKAYTQLIHHRFKKAEDIKTAEVVSKMDAQLDKLTNLISDLLDVTKVKSGKLQFRAGYFDFNEVVEEVIEETQRTTTHKIIKELMNSKTVYGDRDRIGQVIVNFLTNAIKYSPDAEKINVRTLVSKDSIMLSVQDFGIGLSKEEQKKVFERFYRAGGEKQETFPGLGLGLYISSEIIKRHNGRLWVESTKGKGSTFHFSLPTKKRILE